MKPSIQKATYILLFLVLSTIILMNAGSVLKPFAFALIAVSIYLKPAQWVERSGVSRAWSIFIVMFCGSAIILVFGYFISRETVEVMTSLKSELNIDQPSQAIADKINEKVPNEWVHLDKQEVTDSVKKWMGDVGVPFIGDTFKSTGYILSNGVLTLIYTFFILLYRKGIAEAISNLGSMSSLSKSNDVLRKIIGTGQKYITGLGMLILLLSTLYATTFWLFGLDYPVVFAVVAATLAVIPYVGTTLGASLPVIYAYLYYDNHFIALGLIVAIMGIQMLEGNILTPKIVGGNMKLNPLVSLMAVVIGNFIWGLAGMILFLPLMAMIKIILEHTQSLKPIADLSGQNLEKTD